MVAFSETYLKMMLENSEMQYFSNLISTVLTLPQNTYFLLHKDKRTNMHIKEQNNNNNATSWKQQQK